MLKITNVAKPDSEVMYVKSYRDFIELTILDSVGDSGVVSLGFEYDEDEYGKRTLSILGLDENAWVSPFVGETNRNKNAIEEIFDWVGDWVKAACEESPEEARQSLQSEIMTIIVKYCKDKKIKY